MTKRKVLKPHKKGIIPEDVIKEAVKSVREMNRYKVKFSLSGRCYYFVVSLKVIFCTILKKLREIKWY